MVRGLETMARQNAEWDTMESVNSTVEHLR